MSKILDLRRPVGELIDENPDLKELLIGMGFKELGNPFAFKVMAKTMTIPKSAAIKNMDMSGVTAALAEHGYETVGKVPAVLTGSAGSVSSAKTQNAMPLEKAEENGAQKKQNNLLKSKQLTDIYGHPLNLLHLENDGLECLLQKTEADLASGEVSTLQTDLISLKSIKIHYDKKEELMMPILEKYGVTGPSEVMWNMDDDIRDEISMHLKDLKEKSLTEKEKAIRATIQRIRGMIYQEEKILHPTAAGFFTDEEWYEVYRDIPLMGYAFVDVTALPKWEEAENWIAEQRRKQASEQDLLNGKIHTETGNLTVAQLYGILKLLPVDITFIDENEITRFFMNMGNVFARPISCLNREMWACHPPRIIPMVKGMLQSFKNHERDHMVFWTPSKINPIKVVYHAIYDDDDRYIGTVEIVQQFGEDLEKLKEFMN